MRSMPLDALLSPRRRGWILFTAILATVMFSWASINRLSELIEVQDLPYDIREHSLLELAEKKIASQLHFKTGFRSDKDHLDASDGRDSGFGSTFNVGRSQEKDQRAGPRFDDSEPILRGATGDLKAGATVAQSRGLPPACAAKVLTQTDFWGEALVAGPQNKVDSWEHCCNKCAQYKPKIADDPDCNVWVFCGDELRCGVHYGECWLKHLAHPEGTAPSKQGPDVGWTTGLMQAPGVMEEANAHPNSEEDRRFHVVISAQGPATHWQSRVHYYWYKKIKKQCEEKDGEKCEMGGFTRILHSGTADDLMEEIPTYVAQTLPLEYSNHGYVVLNRPWAFVQWAQQAEIPEKYVLMSEPDHVWLRPMPNLMIGKKAAAFPFFYIEPSKKEYLSIVQRFLGPITRKETEEIAPIGNAPTMLAFEDLQRVAPLWFNLSIAIHNDEEAVKQWGWVQEMYAFTLAAYKAGMRDIQLHLTMMAQPPFDTNLMPYFILHYTYGMDYTLEGVFTPGKYGEWRFDKRTYSGLPPPRNLAPPPNGMTNELVRHLIKAINEATNAIPGWDEYAKTGVATQHWNGKFL